MPRGTGFYINLTDSPDDVELAKAVAIKCVQEEANISAIGRALLKLWVQGRFDRDPELQDLLRSESTLRGRPRED